MHCKLGAEKTVIESNFCSYNDSTSLLGKWGLGPLTSISGSPHKQDPRRPQTARCQADQGVSQTEPECHIRSQGCLRGDFGGNKPPPPRGLFSPKGEELDPSHPELTKRGPQNEPFGGVERQELRAKAPPSSLGRPCRHAPLGHHHPTRMEKSIPSAMTQEPLSRFSTSCQRKTGENPAFHLGEVQGQRGLFALPRVGAYKYRTPGSMLAHLIQVF